MVIIPAIDILKGECVRLYKGNYNESTVYEKEPAAMARKFAELGAKRIHIVDLDAARGSGDNRKQIRKVRKAVPGCIIELGGGIRSEEDVEELFDLGIDRLVIGTMLVKNPNKVEGWVRHYGEGFIAGIDAEKGKVKVSGWESETNVKDTEIAKKAADMGFSSIIYTNIEKDGTLEGPDIEQTLAVSKAAGIPVILSGGISSEEDIAAVAKADSTLVPGCITGKAVYEKKLDLAALFQKYQADEEMTW